MNTCDTSERYRRSCWTLPSCAVWFALITGALGSADGRTAAASPYQFPMSKAPQAALATKPSGPNPMLAFLPAGAQPDLEGWRRWMTQKSQEKRTALPPIDPTKLIIAGESEPNGTQATANSITGFGTGGGEDAATDVSGAIAPPVAPSVIGPFPEDDGSIPLASSTGVVTGSAVKTSQFLGDGPYGSGGTGSGDYDFFVITGVAAGDTITVDIDAQVL